VLGALSNRELQRPVSASVISYQIGGGPSWQIRLVRFFWA
jgi:hypothetical protein